MFDGWFAFKLAPDGDVEDGCYPEEAGAPKAYLGKRTTAAKAAQVIAGSIMATRYCREDHVHIWTLLIDASLELP
jgi:hypothetical protein